MKSFIERIRRAKNQLNHVETVVTLEDGSAIVVERGSDGSFKQVLDDGDDNLEISSEATEGSVFKATTIGNDGVDLSKKQLKKRTRLRRCGFVIDMNPDLQMANVSKGVYLGSQDAAHDLEVLKEHKITHIVNCATGISNIYEGKFRYLNINVLDMPDVNLRMYFDEAHNFMRKCVESGGNVFVHCNAGVSRSPTIVLSYIMRFEDKKLKDALDQVQAVRRVAPNPGFLRQLLIYEEELKTRKALST